MAAVIQKPDPVEPPGISKKFDAELVSIIIPTYNRAHIVTYTLESVFAQTYRPIELIIVDNGSTDETGEVLERWQNEHSGGIGLITRVVSEETRGAPAARNRGLKEACGEFIQFLDDDDALGPEKIAIQVGWLKAHRDYDMVYGSVYHLGRGDKRAYQANVFLDRLAALKRSIRTHTFNTISPLYTRKAVRQTGFWNEQMACGQDRDYVARFLCTELKYEFLPPAEVFVRGYAQQRERVSYLNEPHRRRDYWFSKLISLESLWACLPEPIERDVSFRHTFSKECLAVAKESFLLGDNELGRRGLALSSESGSQTSYLPMIVFMVGLTKVLGPEGGARLFHVLQKCIGGAWRAIRRG